jgi:hypothetical protein
MKEEQLILMDYLNKIAVERRERIDEIYFIYLLL